MPLQTRDNTNSFASLGPGFSPAVESATEDQMLAGLREHLGVCNALLELAHKESEALRNPAPFPAIAIQLERKALLSRLESALSFLVQKRNLWQQSGPEILARNPQVARLHQIALDTIMRILVLDRENEQHLLRRGLMSPRALPTAEPSQPGFVARLYQRHAQP